MPQDRSEVQQILECLRVSLQARHGEEMLERLFQVTAQEGIRGGIAQIVDQLTDGLRVGQDSGDLHAVG
ncbi:hypothetical protein [Nesterenkonia halotolerans]|uniref:Uncharacterized protein n=1 Tax=Nesterenkonia halotolerans TaxID=225325 RepID=A0ABR9J726_9MICC|nr:hypothetical protein [Nesterenkonia halotolerans]MBE1514705.1 hypothetical protein [Nesterenkonia halotolerans]